MFYSPLFVLILFVWVLKLANSDYYVHAFTNVQKRLSRLPKVNQNYSCRGRRYPEESLNCTVEKYAPSANVFQKKLPNSDGSSSCHSKFGWAVHNLIYPNDLGDLQNSASINLNKLTSYFHQVALTQQPILKLNHRIWETDTGGSQWLLRE